jgi:hypothetical protein
MKNEFKKFNEFKNTELSYNDVDILLKKFKEETCLLSDFNKIANNENFIQIISFGYKIIPFLMDKLLHAKSFFLIVMIKHILKDRLDIKLLDDSVDELYNKCLKWWELNKNEFTIL